MAIVEVRVPPLGLRLGLGRAVALVSETYRADGVHALVVPVGTVGGVDGRVAKAFVLGDHRAACLRLVEGHSKTGQVEAEPALDYGAVVGRVDGGVFHRHIREAHEEGTRARLRARDQARRLAAWHGRTRVRRVEPVTGLLSVEPRRGVDDSRELALCEARHSVARGVVVQNGEVG
eukprot:scaffold57140_cov93-Phaeocystis_antarctica.AAC.1